MQLPTWKMSGTGGHLESLPKSKNDNSRGFRPGKSLNDVRMKMVQD